MVALGAGFDTAYLRLKEGPGPTPRGYFEVDFAEVVARKQHLIAQHEEMSAIMGELRGSVQEGGYHSVDGVYHLLSGDLRVPEAIGAALVAAGLDRTRPTLWLAECVLVYLERQHAQGILAWAAAELETAAFALYEQIGPHDAFGQMMLRNLEVSTAPRGPTPNRLTPSSPHDTAGARVSPLGAPRDPRSRGPEGALFGGWLDDSRGLGHELGLLVSLSI